MLVYYIHDGPEAFRFELAGELDSKGAARLEQDWKTASSTIGRRALIVDLGAMSAIEPAGRDLLLRWQTAGAKIIGKSKESWGLPGNACTPPAPPRADSGVFLSRGLKSALATIPLLAVLALPTPAMAAELKPATLSAWEQDVQAADGAMQERIRAGAPFLSADGSPQARQQLRDGEFMVVPVGEHNPKKVPGGLIHHWMGVAFFPNTTLDEVLGVLRDYPHYKDYYAPNLVAAKTIQQEPEDDHFSTVVTHRGFFLNSALDSECNSSYVHAGPKKLYSITDAIRVQEIQDYGELTQHSLPAGHGLGYIWKFHSITRYEEADGGVYMEIDAMVLSRDIPAAIHWAVDPIVRRVSRESMMTSLRQTREAVSSEQAVISRSHPLPSPACSTQPAICAPLRNR